MALVHVPICVYQPAGALRFIILKYILLLNVYYKVAFVEAAVEPQYASEALAHVALPFPFVNSVVL